MRWLVVALAACGSASEAKDATAPGGEPVPDPDAAVVPACPNPVHGTTITLRQLNPNPNRLGGVLTIATSPPLDPRLFVVRIDGVIRIFKDEVVQPTPFLDLRDDIGGPVATGPEMGLLGLAFHPQYASNGQFFVYYTTGTVTNNTMRDVLARCTVGMDPDVADPASCVEILSIDDPATNHNGGMLEFGADGYLYLATGDGGGPDGHLRPQDTSLLFGKMLRLDVDHKAPGMEYGIPSDNPFAAGGGRPEIYMLGMRNPWRWSFDRATGDMWIGDVGVSAKEELDVVPAGKQAGANLGWAIYEADNCAFGPCNVPHDLVFPLDVRSHGGANPWAAIIGGQVYRGSCFPDIVGTYFYGDNSLSALVAARLKPDGTLAITDLPGTYVFRPTSLHADARGELYMTDMFGSVYRLEAGP